MRLAGMLVCFSPAQGIKKLSLPQSFFNFLSEDSENPDVRVEVQPEIPGSYVEKDLSMVSCVSSSSVLLPQSMNPPDYLWKVFKKRNGYILKTWSYAQDSFLPCTIEFNPGSTLFKLSIAKADKDYPLLAYPAGGLFIYLLSGLQTSFLIHGSAVEWEGHAYVFPGRSGKGKSTMAQIWEEKGARVIHDDRLMLVRKEDEWYVYSTPVNEHDHYNFAPVKETYLIDHGKENIALPLKGLEAYTSIMEHCIQHQYDKKMIDALLDALELFSGEIPIYTLQFRKGSEIVDYILSRTYST